jgi:cytochrome c
LADLPRGIARVGVTGACLSVVAALAAAQDRGDSEYGLMVEADGVEETFYACTACHSEMIIVQQGKTREGWDKMLHWMVEEQGMPELEVEERETILDYLATYYNTDRPNFPAR